MIRKIDKLLKAEIIEPSYASWSSPILIVFKKDRSPQAIIDYRRLNKVTKPDEYALPNAQDLFMAFGEGHACWFSSLDLRSGFHQIGVEESSKDHTTFSS